MKRTVWLWSLFGFAISSLLGTLLHFLYEWTGESVFVAPFSGVNESTFEHMKLLFWPMLAYTVFQSFFFRSYEGFACIKLRSVLIGLSLIPILFYTFSGAFGESPDWLNITFFFLAAGLGYFVEGLLFKKEFSIPLSFIPIGILLTVAVMFAVFTFSPPRLPLFQDPLTGGYGLLPSIIPY